jgi:hypothetical protein
LPTSGHFSFASNSSSLFLEFSSLRKPFRDLMTDFWADAESVPIRLDYSARSLHRYFFGIVFVVRHPRF